MVPLSRSRSDVARMSPLDDRMEDKVIVSDLQTSYSNKKSIGTPIKMLIDREMSKELDSRHSQPNVVAKLMGLETLPVQKTDSSFQRIRSRGHPRSHSDIPMSDWEQQNGFSQYARPNEFKDVYEILQSSPSMGSCDQTTNDNRMALVRQKFDEAKRLSMDEKLRQTKQFQDALEVLNTNKDLFLKCLQEPNPMFSQDLYKLQSIPPHPETKRITVLRPSKMIDNNNFLRAVNEDRKQSKKGTFAVPNGLEKSQLVNSPPASWKSYDIPCQPTRIVVLKPSPVKSHDIKAVGSPQSDSPRGLHGEEFFGDAVDDENQESREVAKAITKQMREKLAMHHRDEALVSSVLSNGYVDDESSFNKSEINSAAGNLSDSEVLSPVSRHSWDYINRFESPYSSSSFSRVSYSPESSVCIEAKKRLSERWVMMSSNRSYLEQRHERRRSSTLGEMLALSETKKAVIPREEDNLKEEPVDYNSVITELRTPENVNNSPRNLMRSKSVPVSSTECGTRINTNISVPDEDRPEAPKEETKEKHVKSSFKGKVSSLFFSKNKKASKDKSLSPGTEDEFHHKIFPGLIDSHKNSDLNDEGPGHFSCILPNSSNKASSSNQVFKLGTPSSETGSSTEKYITSGNPIENLDQPSPISVLDRSFEEDQCSATVFSHYVMPKLQGVELPVNTIRSNLIDKSPPIGSIARTLSRDDLCVDLVSPYSLNQSITAQKTDEEQEWLFFVKTLLAAADLQGEVGLNTFWARWHSPESPLDPSLRDKYTDLKDKEPLHEARRRQKRSTQKLVFDCVNASLVDFAGYGSLLGQRAIPCIKSNKNILENPSFTMLDEVWTRMNALFSGGIKCVLNDCGDDDILVLERVVRKEVVGKGWINHLIMVTDTIGKEMEEKLLEELVQDTVVELSTRV